MGLVRKLVANHSANFKTSNLSLRKLLPEEWYFHPRVDYYIFVIFSWIVWVPLFAAFGVYGLYRGASYLSPIWTHLPHLGGWEILQWFPWAADKKFPTLAPSLANLANPQTDLDLTTSTDSEDLAIFAADVLEFAEQDHSLLLDSLFEFGLGGLCFGGFLALLGRRTLPSALLRRRRR